MSELPKGWALTTLGQVGKWGSGGTPKRTNEEYYNGDIPWLVIGDLNDDIVNESKNSITELGVKNSSAKLIDEGTLLIAMYGSIGKLGIAGFKCTTNQAIANCVVNDDLVNKKYLFYFLKSRREHLLSLGKGGAQQNISQSVLKAYECPIAPLNEQKRIADKLDSILAKVDRAQARLDKIPGILKRFRQSILAAATSGELTREWRGGSDHNWKTVSLGMVGKGFNYGTSAKSHPEGNVPVLRMGNLQGGELDWNDLVYTSDNNEIKKYSLEKGDVLFNRTNSPELVGKTSIYRGEREAIYAGYLIRIKGSERLNTEFLNIQLNSPHARDYCWQVKTDGVSQSNINAKKLQAYEFDLPDMEEQLEIVRRVSELFSHAMLFECQYIESKKRFDRLSQSVLAKAFRGELVEHHLADEPADKLLERIKQQQLEAPKVVRQTRKPAAKVAPSVDVIENDVELARPESEILALLKKTNGELSAQQIIDKLTEKTFEQVDALFTELKRLLDNHAIVKVGSGEACTFKAIKR